MKQATTNLAAKGVFIGTSTWKYDRWFGQLYSPARNEYRGKYRGKVAKTRFERDCLGEYPVLEIETRVESFENGRGFSLRVLRAGAPRKLQSAP